MALTLVAAATGTAAFLPPKTPASATVAVWVNTRAAATMSVLAKRERRQGRAARRRRRQEALGVVVAAASDRFIGLSWRGETPPFCVVGIGVWQGCSDGVLLKEAGRGHASIMIIRQKRGGCHHRSSGTNKPRRPSSAAGAPVCACGGAWWVGAVKLVFGNIEHRKTKERQPPLLLLAHSLDSIEVISSSLVTPSHSLLYTTTHRKVEDKEEEQQRKTYPNQQ